MGSAVHAHRVSGFAPAAAGFDARLIGGDDGGRPARRRDAPEEMAAALASSPDAIGLISWNEFSENSHVEPSRRYGSTSLRVIADIRDTPAPSIPDFNSDAAPAHGRSYGAPLVAGMALIVALLVVTTIRKRRPKGSRRTAKGWRRA